MACCRFWSLMGNEGWCMSGYHAVSALADAVAKGADISVGEALMAMDHTANVPYYEGVEAYKKIGLCTFRSKWDGCFHYIGICL